MFAGAVAPKQKPLEKKCPVNIDALWPMYRLEVVFGSSDYNVAYKCRFKWILVWGSDPQNKGLVSDLYGWDCSALRAHSRQVLLESYIP